MPPPPPATHSVWVCSGSRSGSSSEGVEPPSCDVCVLHNNLLPHNCSCHTFQCTWRPSSHTEYGFSSVRIPIWGGWGYGWDERTPHSLSGGTDTRGACKSNSHLALISSGGCRLVVLSWHQNPPKPPSKYPFCHYIDVM